MASCFVLSWSRTNRWATSSELRAAEHQEDRVKEDMMSPLLPVCVWIINTNSCNVILSSTPAESVTSLQSLKALRIHVLLSTSVGNYDLHIYTQWFLSVDILWAVDRQTSGLLWIAALCCFTVSLYLHFCESYIFLHSDGFIVCSQTSQLDENAGDVWEVRLDLLVLLIGFPQRHL